MGSSGVPDNHDPGPVPSAHTKLRERGISSVTAHAGCMPRPTTAPSQSFSVEPPELFMIKSEFYSPLLSPALLAAKFQCWHYANGAQSPFPTPQPHAIFYWAIVSLRQYRRHHILSPLLTVSSHKGKYSCPYRWVLQAHSTCLCPTHGSILTGPAYNQVQPISPVALSVGTVVQGAELHTQHQPCIPPAVFPAGRVV